MEVGAPELAVGDAPRPTSSWRRTTSRIASSSTPRSSSAASSPLACRARASSSPWGAGSCRRDRRDRVAWCGPRPASRLWAGALARCCPIAIHHSDDLSSSSYVLALARRAGSEAVVSANAVGATTDPGLRRLQAVGDPGAGSFVIGVLDPADGSRLGEVTHDDRHQDRRAPRRRDRHGPRHRRGRRGATPRPLGAGAASVAADRHGALGPLDRRGLGRAAHNHHLPRAAAGRCARSLRHGARRHRRHRVRQSGLPGGAASRSSPTARSRFSSPTPRAARKRWMPGTANTPMEEMGDVKFCMAFLHAPCTFQQYVLVDQVRDMASRQTMDQLGERVHRLQRGDEPPPAPVSPAAQAGARC